MNPDSSKDFIKLLIGIAGFFTILILLILTIFIWIPELKYNDDIDNIKEEVSQQGEGLAASLYDEEKELRDVISGDEADTAADEPVVSVPTQPTNQVAPGNFQVTMTTEWNYPDINTPAEDSYVENGTNNTYDASFLIVLADDESQALYSSPLMPVGSFMKDIPIKARLVPGTYDCVVIYTLYAPGTEEKAGTIRVALTINIGPA
ncbi:MAG: hypothetical protein K5669_06305 [Lachnospiraceae bacterium]|nr:hypothetical protein [Lachnospiraceae bacterium]